MLGYICRAIAENGRMVPERLFDSWESGKIKSRKETTHQEEKNMGYNIKTPNGYDLFEMSSMIQKAIRRSDIPHAAYAANELGGKYRKYLWKRLLTVSAEDCYGIMTKEIVALQQADEYVNKKAKIGETNDLFIAKAVILLCMARKNRDADYVACNFMWGDKNLTEEEFNQFVDYEQVENLRIRDASDIPGYVYDVHTWKGKRAGKTELDMFHDEQEALAPRQMNLFDYGDWGGYFGHMKQEGKLDRRTESRLEEFQRGKTTDPTNNGTTWTPETYEAIRMK